MATEFIKQGNKYVPFDAKTHKTVNNVNRILPLEINKGLDNVTKDYMWKQKHHIDDVFIAQRNNNPLLDKEGKHYRKVVPIMAKVFNPVTGKIETVNIKEHNKRVFSGAFKQRKTKKA